MSVTTTSSHTGVHILESTVIIFELQAGTSNITLNIVPQHFFETKVYVEKYG